MRLPTPVGPLHVLPVRDAEQAGGQAERDSHQEHRRTAEKPQVEPEIAIPYVIEVECQLVIDLAQKSIRRELHLRQARQPGADDEAISIARDRTLQDAHEFGPLGSWPD